MSLADLDETLLTNMAFKLFPDEVLGSRIRYFFDIRNLITHRYGYIDRHFLDRNPTCDAVIGAAFVVTMELTRDALSDLGKAAADIQKRAEITSALSTKLKSLGELSGGKSQTFHWPSYRRLALEAETRGSWPDIRNRDLNGAVVRMSTLARGGRISTAIVEEEIARLRGEWHGQGASPRDTILIRCLGEERIAALDAFDRVQLEHVLAIARRARSISDAGRLLFGASRQQKTSANDADRLRKYLARFGLDWKMVREEG